MSVKLVASCSVVLAAFFASGCRDRNPSAPSPNVLGVGSTTDIPQFLGMWNVTVRLTAVNGNGCVADTMRSQIGMPSRYSLSITQKNSVLVTLKSTSQDHACTFKPSADANGFTTYGVAGYYTCEPFVLSYVCTDGSSHNIYTVGEDISGQLTGSELSGTWDAVWFEGDDPYGVEMRAQFSGSRQ